MGLKPVKCPVRTNPLNWSSYFSLVGGLEHEWIIFSIYWLVGGFKHFLEFSIIYGMSSFPLTNSYFFQMVIAPPTSWEFHHPNSLSLIFFKGVGRLKPPTSPLSRLRQWKGWGEPSPTGCYFERSTVATGREVVAAGKPRALDENRVIWWTWNWYLTSQMLLLDREDDGKWWFKHIWICLILWVVYFQMNPFFVCVE